MIRKTAARGTVDVYLARIPEAPAYRPVQPAERQTLIETTRNKSVRAQRFTAWETLLFGLSHSRGIDAADAKLRRDQNGKWVSGVCGISISHCRTAVAAAIASDRVGIDVEPAEDPRYREALLKRIAAQTEQEAFSALPAGLRIATLWTRKEAAFKRRGGKTFSPIAENALSPDVRTVRIRLADADYTVSVSAEADMRLRVFEVRDGAAFERTDWETITAECTNERCFVYMLRCAGDRLYTGVTTDLRRRLSEHGAKKGAKFTRAFRPESVAAAWETNSRSLALKLEARIKALPRRKKNELIETNAFAAFEGAIDPDAYRRIR